MKIQKNDIFGTNIHIYNRNEWSQNTIPVPMVVGHDYSDEEHITCGHCKNCCSDHTHLHRNPSPKMMV